MEREADFKSKLTEFNKRVAAYMPPRESWTRADEALYGPTDLYDVPLDEAERLQLKSIKEAFINHFNNNVFYLKYCKSKNIGPDDIKNVDDLGQIPTIPDTVFKDYPAGKDFALWLANVVTGALPKITVRGRNPSFDQVISAFNEAGMIVAYSSGTSGRFSFIPRDRRTFFAAEYAVAKSLFCMIHEFFDLEFDVRGYLLFPNPKKTSLFVGKVCQIYFDVFPDVRIAIDRELTTDLIQTAMSGGHGLKGRMTSYVQNRMQQRMIAQIIEWLERREKEEIKTILVGAPFIVYLVMDKLQDEGKTFNFGENGAVVTGGGWKINENVRLPLKEFRSRVDDVLGIPHDRCVDVYAMVEGNGMMVHCPEGHYLHTPYTYYKPLVLDENAQPVEYGEWGRFAFLDSLARSYPGFVASGDRVRLLMHCPVCDRPGPVLEPEISRMTGEDVRGCSEEVRKVLATDFSEG